MSVDAMKRALEALEDPIAFAKGHAAKAALRLAIKQAERQEPVAWGVDWGKAGDIPCVSIIKRLADGGMEVVAVEYAPYAYTAPPQRQPLTEAEIEALARWADEHGAPWHIAFARAIERAHGIGGEHD